MKIVVVVLTISVYRCLSYQFFIPETQLYQVPIINIGGASHTILYSKENKDDILINSMLSDIFANQVVELHSGENITITPSNKDSNLIILTETLYAEDLYVDPFNTLLYSYWSPLHFVVTAKEEYYACENGTFTKKAFAEIKYFLNELWQFHRIVRVILSFPYSCPKHFIIYDGKDMSFVPVYRRNIKVIKPGNDGELATALIRSGDVRYLAQGYPLRANIFHRFPTSITVCDVANQYTGLNSEDNFGLCGLDAFVMQDYMNYYKFDFIVTSSDCDKYGYLDPENNVTVGSLGCIVKDKIDISFNSRFLEQYTTENYVYLHYITQDSLCVVMQKPKNIPLWHYVHNTFNPFIWIMIIVCVIILGIVAWLSEKILNRVSEKRRVKLRTHIFNAITSTLFGFLKNNNGRFLILKGTSLVCSVILIAVFQGHVSYQFTTRTQALEIKTLKQLYHSDTILYTSPSLKELLKTYMDTRNAKQAEFLKRVHLRPSTSLEFIQDHKKSATLSRKQDVMISVFYNHTDKYGMAMFYVLDECYQTYYLSFIARKGFLFIEDSLIFMMRILEAGLPKQYYIWTRHSFNLADKYPSNGPKPRPSKKVNLSKLRSAFGFLIVSYVVCTIVFIVEKWWGRGK